MDAAVALLIRVAGAGLMFGLQVLLARVMPIDDYGGYVTLWTWMLALGSFAALGFAESSVRFLPRYQLRNRSGLIRAYCGFSALVVLGVSSVLALAAIALLVSSGMTDGASLTIVLILLGLPLLGIEYLLEGVARSFGWFRLAAVPVYILRPVLIGAVCLGFFANSLPLTLPVVGAILLGCMAVITSLMALLVGWRLRQVADGGAKKIGRKQQLLWLRASLPLLVLSGLEDLTSYADILMLTLLADDTLVSIYFAAARALALGGFIAYAMTLVAGRRFALDLAGRSRSQLQDSIIQSTRLTFWATTLAVLATIAAGPWLLATFGPQFSQGQGVLVVLGLGMILRSLSGQAAEVLVVTGRQQIGLWIGLGVLLVTILSGLILIPALGIIGAAMASAIAMACRSLALIVALHRVANLRTFSVGLPRLAVSRAA